MCDGEELSGDGSRLVADVTRSVVANQENQAEKGRRQNNVWSSGKRTKVRESVVNLRTRGMAGTNTMSMYL